MLGTGISATATSSNAIRNGPQPTQVEERTNQSFLSSKRTVAAAATATAAFLAGALAVSGLSYRGTHTTARPVLSAAPIADTTAGSQDTSEGLKSEGNESSLPAPHIILITIDDLGFNDMGYQSTDIPDATPFMFS